MLLYLVEDKRNLLSLIGEHLGGPRSGWGCGSSELVEGGGVKVLISTGGMYDVTLGPEEAHVTQTILTLKKGYLKGTYCAHFQLYIVLLTFH